MYKKRVLAIAVSIFMAGVIFGIVMNDYDTVCFRAIFIILAALSVITLAVFSFIKGKNCRKRLTAAAFAVAAFSLGTVRILLYNSTIDNTEIYDGKEDSAEIRITEINQNYLEAVVNESKLGVPYGESLRFYPENMPEKCIVGDIIKCDIKYHHKTTNNLLSNGITLVASGEIIDHSPGNGIFYQIRKSVYNNSNRFFGNFEFASGVSKGVTIGDRSGIDSYVFSVYQTSGISHLLAISGLHISIISMTLFRILQCFTIGRKTASVISAIFALGFSALVGFTPGTVRAAIMLCIVMIMRISQRNSDGFSSLFFALLVLLVFNPYSICSPGLQLSFLSTFGIMLTEPFLDKIHGKYFMRRRADGDAKAFGKKLIYGIIASFLISLVSAIFTFPVLFVSFDAFSYISPIINVIAVPLFSLAVELCLITYILAPILGILTIIFAFPAAFLFDLVTNISELIFRADIGTLSVHLPFMIIPFLLSLTMIIVLIFAEHKRNKKFICATSAFCISLLLCFVYHKISVGKDVFVEYGNYGAEYVYFCQGGTNLYIDIDGYIANSKVIYQSGETSLDNYIMLGYNEYSLERYEHVSSDMKISNIYIPRPTNKADATYFNEIKELANSRNCDIIFFDNSFAKLISEDSSIQIIGNIEDLSERTLITLEVDGAKMCFLGNGFSNAVMSDITVITNGYAGDTKDIVSKTIYSDDEYIKESDNKRKISAFKDSIRIEIDISESDYKIYEP